MIKAYASYFVSYFLSKISADEINSIILFGSTARGESSKDSDVDLFIEVKKYSKKIESNYNKILDEFYTSREALLFKSKGVENKINLIIGKLDEWKSLKKSVESTGIVLYGPYLGKNTSGTKHVIVFWDSIGENRGAFLNKLYGFLAGEKRYPGLVEKYNGQRLGKSCVMIPVEYREEFMKVLKYYKVNAKIQEVYR